MAAMRTDVIAVSLIILLFASSSWGAIGSWQNYTYSNDSRDIVSDGRNVWCATSGGLVRYDTQTGGMIKYLNSDGLGDIDLISIGVDSAGTIYVGGSNSTLTRIGTGGDISVDEFQYSNEIRYKLTDFYADGEIMWIATEVGVSKYLIYRNGGEFQETYSDLGGLPLEVPVRAVMTIGDYLWAGTDSGLAYIERDNPLPQNPDNWFTILRDQNGLSDPLIKTMALVGDTLMVGTPSGVFWMDTDSLWHNIGPPLTVFDLELRNGNLVAASNDGIYERANGAWQLLSIDSLISDNARAITVDNQDNLWVAFNQGAFAFFNGSYWETKSIPGPVSNRIQDLAIDSLNNIWLVHTVPGFSGRAGITRFNGEDWINYNYLNSGLGINAAVVVEYDIYHDLMWFGSWGDGLISFDRDATWRVFDETNSPLRGVENAQTYVPVSSINIDFQGNVWALNLKGFDPEVVMAVFNPDDSLWLSYIETAGQITDNFQHVIYTVGNTVYVCGELQNINRLDFGANATDTTDDQWLSQLQGVEQVRDLLIDDDGKLFVASATGLLYYDFVFQEPYAIELPDGYRSAINCLALDGLGNKWVGTDSGVVVLASKVEPGNVNWEQTFKTSNSFLLNNSVLSIEVDDNTGLVYVGTAGGLSVYESGFVAPSPSLDNMAVYPNPVIAREEEAEINFLRVPADAEIWIYTASGDLVKKLDYESTKTWDLRNDNNRRVAAGVYVFYVRSGEKSGTGKFAVIR